MPLNRPASRFRGFCRRPAKPPTRSSRAADAKRQADETVAKAKAEAEQIVATAKTEAEDLRARTHAEVEDLRARTQSEADELLRRSQEQVTSLEESAKARMRDIQADTDKAWKERGELLEDIRGMANTLVELAGAAANHMPLLSRHIRSTGPMSVGHSRRISRMPSPSTSGRAASSSCRWRSTPSFCSAADSPMSCVTSLSTSASRISSRSSPFSLRTTIASPLSSTTVGGVIQFRRLTIFRFRR